MVATPRLFLTAIFNLSIYLNKLETSKQELMDTAYKIV